MSLFFFISSIYMDSRVSISFLNVLLIVLIFSCYFILLETSSTTQLLNELCFYSMKTENVHFQLASKYLVDQVYSKPFQFFRSSIIRFLLKRARIEERVITGFSYHFRQVQASSFSSSLSLNWFQLLQQLLQQVYAPTFCELSLVRKGQMTCQMVQSPSMHAAYQLIKNDKLNPPSSFRQNLRNVQAFLPFLLYSYYQVSLAKCQEAFLFRFFIQKAGYMTMMNIFNSRSSFL